MKKILSLVSALALTLPLLAGTVTFKPGDFAGQGKSSTGGDVTATKGGITVACNKAYGASDALRCYKDGVLTITSEKTIQTMDFSFQSADGKYHNGGIAEGNNLTAHVEVNALSWTFTMAKQGRITELVITIDGEGVEPEKVDTISVTQALARLADASGNKGECYVKGKVLSIITNNVETYGNISYWMADLENPNDSLQAYRMKAANNVNYKDAASVEFVEGDEILVYAAGLAMYHNDNTNQDIPELNTGYYCKTLKGKEIVALDWAIGSAYLENDGWTLDISKANNDDANVMSLKIKSSKKDALAGFYTLTTGSSIALNGSNTAIISGSIKLTFKEVGVNSLNVYTAQVVAVTSDKAYRINKEIEFYASDANGDEIVLTGDRPYVPKEGEELTCAQAQEYAFSLASGATGDISVVVKGYVTKIVDATTFWMDDAKGSKETFEAYKVKNFTPVGKEIALGSQVKLTGKVTNYNGKTAEIKDGSVEIIDGVDIQVTEATVAEALAACKALAQNASSTDTYAITGFITGIAREFSDQYGNISFWMSDQAGDEAAEFQAYNVKCDATLAAKLVAGAKVKVTDKLKHFHQDAKPAEGDQPEKPERTVYETVGGGSVELIQGAAVEVIRTDAPAVKFIENGQIIIIRNGVRYNVQGQLAK